MTASSMRLMFASTRASSSFQKAGFRVPRSKIGEKSGAFLPGIAHYLVGVGQLSYVGVAREDIRESQHAVVVHKKGKASHGAVYVRKLGAFPQHPYATVSIPLEADYLEQARESGQDHTQYEV